jgi:hypothetical protein
LESDCCVVIGLEVWREDEGEAGEEGKEVALD